MFFYALNNGLYIISFHTLQTSLVLFVFQYSFLLHSRTRRDCDIWYCKKWMVCGNHFASIFYHYKQGMPIIHLLSPTCLTTFYNGRSISRCLIFCMHGHPFFMINWNYVYKICWITRVSAWYSCSTRKRIFLLHLGDPKKSHQIRFDINAWSWCMD